MRAMHKSLVHHQQLICYLPNLSLPIWCYLHFLPYEANTLYKKNQVKNNLVFAYNKFYLLTASFKPLPALKTGFFDAGIVISAPV